MFFVVSILNNLDDVSDKVRIRNSYRKLILAEAKELDKSYLETVHFMIDCYFAVKKGVLNIQQPIAYTPVLLGVDITHNQAQQCVSSLPIYQEQEDAEGETFSLDFDLSSWEVAKNIYFYAY